MREIKFSRNILEGVASRVWKTKLDFQRANKAFNQALKEAKKPADDGETMDHDIGRLRAERLAALKEYESAKVIRESVQAVPPLSL